MARSVALATVAVACLGSLGPVVSATAADAFEVQRTQITASAVVTSLVIDPARVRVSAGVASGGGRACFGGGAAGNACQDALGTIVTRERADLGTTANYSDGVNILGTVIVNHHAYSPPNPSTNSLCVTGVGPAQRLAIVAIADPGVCTSAVSGERLVSGGRVTVGGDGPISQNPFWSSVQAGRAVQRTLVGVRADGRMVLAVASGSAAGERDGMTLLEAARWLLARGARDGMALDGGHQAGMFSAVDGDLVPLERGVIHLQSALLFTRLPQPPPPPPAPSPAPPLPDTAMVSPLPDTALVDPLPDTGLPPPPAPSHLARLEPQQPAVASPVDTVGRAWRGIVADIRKFLNHP